MKNTIYAVVIAVCIIGAIVVFVVRRSGKTNADGLSDTKMTWVKCTKCNQSYEMSEKAYWKDLQEKRASVNASPIAPNPLLTCAKCGQDGIRRAFKCENQKCGEVFFANSVPNDLEDRCPKCKHSAMEEKRNANKARMNQ
jgi:hypothetical protein